MTGNIAYNNQKSQTFVINGNTILYIKIVLFIIFVSKY